MILYFFKTEKECRLDPPSPSSSAPRGVYVVMTLKIAYFYDLNLKSLVYTWKNTDLYTIKLLTLAYFSLYFHLFPIMRTIANRQKPTINKNNESEIFSKEPIFAYL